MSDATAPVAWVCQTCGTQVEASRTAPAQCAICDDERQYVGWQGQVWTDPRELAAVHEICLECEDGVVTLSPAPSFAIGQRAFLIPDDCGNVLWESLSFVTPDALTKLAAHGGVRAIAISHPHFYAAMVDWSDALGGVPMYLHEADRHWVQRSSPHLRFWGGERCPLSSNIDLVRLRGHFDGSAGLLWKTGPRPGGSLFAGDALQVTMDRRHVSFMYSYPNAIPLRPCAVRALREAVQSLAFEDLFGYSRGRQIIGGAKVAVDRSFRRYLEITNDREPRALVRTTATQIVAD